MKPSQYIKKGWCQGVNAKDSYGYFCEPTSPCAIKWCLIGAIQAAYPQDTRKRMEIHSKLESHSPIIAHWNDAPNRTQAEVISLLEQIGE